MQNSIKENLNTYLKFFPEEKKLFEKLQQQLHENQDVVSRTNSEGHVTASAMIVNQNKEVLVLFHNKLQKYLQPGGHIEEVDTYIEDSARREAQEEAGIVNAKLDSWCTDNACPILIDTHYIPENIKKNEEHHYHHDFMFVYYVDSKNIILDEQEVSDFKWIPIKDVLVGDSNISIAIRKMNKLGIL